MKILYGIQLNGNGHITRSIEVIDKLKEKGHSVDIITSGNNSKLPFNSSMRHFDGLDLILNDIGSISWFKTIKNLKLYNLIKDTNSDLVSNFDLVISDFEPVSAWSAKIGKKDSIGISNQYSLLSNKIKKQQKLVSSNFIKKFAPCKHFLGINYFELEENMCLPIIGKKIIEKQLFDKNFIVVYLNHYSTEKLVQVFQNFKNIKFIIYSNSNNSTIPENIEIKKLDRDSFIDDLSNCSSVITGCGFSTTSEVLFLKKKLWAIPVKGHFEQLSNAYQLREMGIFTQELSFKNLQIWINEFDSYNYHWIDPMNKIIKIIEGYES